MMRAETEAEKIVAVLHDVVEDSQPPPRWGGDELRREGFSEPVLAVLDGVTRREPLRRRQSSTSAPAESRLHLQAGGLGELPLPGIEGKESLCTAFEREGDMQEVNGALAIRRRVLLA